MPLQLEIYNPDQTYRFYEIIWVKRIETIEQSRQICLSINKMSNKDYKEMSLKEIQVSSQILERGLKCLQDFLFTLSTQLKQYGKKSNSLYFHELKHIYQDYIQLQKLLKRTKKALKKIQKTLSLPKTNLRTKISSAPFRKQNKLIFKILIFVFIVYCVSISSFFFMVGYSYSQPLQTYGKEVIHQYKEGKYAKIFWMEYYIIMLMILTYCFTLIVNAIRCTSKGKNK